MISTVSNSSRQSSKDKLLGTAAAFGAILIWAAWIVGTRQAVTHSLDPAAMGFLRFAVPAVVFAPVWWRSGLLPRGVPKGTLLGLMGAGAPFFLAVATAMRHATASVVGPLLPGTMPLIVALASALLFHERLRRSSIAGLLLIGLGVVAIGSEDILSGARNWPSYALLLAGAAMWAAYTLAYKKSGLSSLTATAVVSAWSALMLAPAGVPALIGAMQAGYGNTIIIQAGIQGILSGVIAILLYGMAVTRLGAAGASAFVALVPGLATLMAIPALREYPSTAAIAGVLATSFGVALMTGVPAPGSAALRRWFMPTACGRPLHDASSR